ncbi:ribose 5-phosphate isomerase B [Marnyiella aurantia]|uniref:Ribose 5-phosphate isomerase B n=1 Tax=Marnyiella aurantia TaxID=2758037 RepID=A0A7D7LP82_9FLAO|nr:ribose 5-phosphate isomerase B [Marnyiella aurantia]MBA5247093.1 ribose 5-phosphate isomerase B [Marnyiella aurantia]MBP0612294.1 ribose 5-phosphate isomerase B [Marnyiella aurantia]QMS97574.1 ribose 5-phosphate isomerase B [Marnyiella aurantia]
MKKLAIACDHAGYEYKEKLKEHFCGRFEIQDFGTDSAESVDYPDFVHPAANSVETGDNELGILICGSGNGVQMSANKHKDVRCALCWMPELAELSRQHNNANMIAIPARFIAFELAVEIIEKFISTEFEGGRHAGRVAKIASC